MANKWTNSLSSGPSVEPVKVDDARRNSDFAESYRDADFERWIIEARERIEKDARTALITQTHVMKLHEFDGDKINLAAVAPVQSVTSISYLDVDGNSQTLATSVYGVSTNGKPAVVYLKNGQSWPTVLDQHDAVTITYVAGYGDSAADVPGSAKSAILMLVRHRLDRPDLLIDDEMVTMPEGWDDAIESLCWGGYP